MMRKIFEKFKIEGDEENNFNLKEFILIIVTGLVGFSLFANIFYIFFGAGALTYVTSAMSCVIAYRIIIKKNRFRGILKKLLNWRTWVLGIIFGIVLTLFNFGASQLVEWIAGGLGSNETSVRGLVKDDTFWACIYVLALAPFIEEFAYRYGVFGYTKKYTRVIAYIASGLIFGAIHLLSAFTGEEINWLVEGLSLLVYSGCGLILCLSYDCTNSLMVSVIAHIFSNTVAVLLLL